MNIKNLLLRRFVRPSYATTEPFVSAFDPEPAWVAPFLAAFEKELVRAPLMATVMKEGARVRTNARYARDISKRPRHGTLLRSLTWITGLWLVRLDGFAQPQHVHKKYLEIEKETKNE